MIFVFEGIFILIPFNFAQNFWIQLYSSEQRVNEILKKLIAFGSVILILNGVEVTISGAIRGVGR